MEAIIRIALRDWSCETGINWVIIDTTHAQGYIEDGKSIIFIDDDLTESTIGFTKPISLGFCYDNSTDKRFAYAKEIDIGFARIPNHKSWDFDTVSTNDIDNNKYDFYEVVMHELGHAHYLEHINNENDIMYYGSYIGPVNANDRKHIFTSPNSIEGGNYIMAKSLSMILDDCEGVEVSTSNHPTYCGTMSTNDLVNSAFKITAYPNPFNSFITVEIDDNQLSDATILYELTDISGKTIVYSTFKNNYTIDLSQLNSGVYLLRINDNNNYINKTIKIIKQ